MVNYKNDEFQHKLRKNVNSLACEKESGIENQNSGKMAILFPNS